MAGYIDDLMADLEKNEPRKPPEAEGTPPPEGGQPGDKRFHDYGKQFEKAYGKPT